MSSSGSNNMFLFSLDDGDRVPVRHVQRGKRMTVEEEGDVG